MKIFKKTMALSTLLLGTCFAQATPLQGKYLPVLDREFLLGDLMAGPWEKASAVSVSLLPQMITTPSKFSGGITAAKVKVVHNGHLVAVVVDWEDPSKDESSLTDQFSDGVAVGFPLKDSASTSPFMGNPGAPVEVNYWKAIWQRDVDKGFTDTKDYYPNSYNDVYYGQSAPNEHGTVEEMKLPRGRTSLPAIAVGNSMSQPERRTPVEQLMAEGFGTLTTQKIQDATARGIHTKTGWRVVFIRPLKTGDANDAVLKPGSSSAFNLAIWEGSQKDAGGRKTYAMWTDFNLDPGEPVKPAHSGHH